MTGVSAEIEPIRQTKAVPVSAERAFQIFAGELASWWPPEYTWSNQVLEDIGIEPRPNGRCYEIGPLGFHIDWGRVLVWEPPQRIVLAWQISPERAPEPNPAKASEIEIAFREDGRAMTVVEFEHRRFERHGEQARAYRDALGSEYGWPYILERYAGAAA